MAAAKLETTSSPQIPIGGKFLLGPLGDVRVHAPESFTEEQRMYYQTAYQFVVREVLPHVDRLEKKDYPLLVEPAAQGRRGRAAQHRDPGGLRRAASSTSPPRCWWPRRWRSFGTWSVIDRRARRASAPCPSSSSATRPRSRSTCPRWRRRSGSPAYALTEAGLGLGRARRQDHGRCSRPTASTTCSTATSSSSPTPASPTSSSCSPRSTATSSPASSSRRGCPGSSSANEEHKLGLRGVVDLRARLRGLQGAGGERARRDRQGPPDRLRHPEHRPAQARRRHHRRREERHRGRVQLRQGPQAVRQEHPRVRADPREARAHGGADVRVGIDVRTGRRASSTTSCAASRPRRAARRPTTNW